MSNQQIIKVIAFDPGITTGYAIGFIKDGRMGVLSGQQKYSHNELYAAMKLAHPDIAVTESFEFRRKSRSGLILFSVEMIGVMALYCGHHGIPLFRQTAMKGKSYYTDAKLKKDHLYKTAKPHANDACRHLLHWYTFGSGYQYNTQGYKPGA